MAELLGAIASGMSVVSLAIQLAESIQKLRSFYSLMQSAPSEILLLLDELETLSLILEDIDSSLQQTAFLDPRTKVAVLKSYRLCRSSGEALVGLVRELEEGVGRKRGRVKFALKKERVEEIKRKLESSKTTMVLAKQCYHEAIARQTWESFERDMVEMKAVMGRMSEQKLLVTCAGSSRIEESKHIADDVDDKMESTARNPQDTSKGPIVSHRRKGGFVSRQEGMRKFFGLLNVVVSEYGGKTATSISLSLPAWIYARKYELCWMKSCQGWDHSFRSYRVVSYDAPVFHLSMAGDVTGLQQLFDAGQASPFEVDPGGRTPLHYAALYARPNVCNFLMDNGADANVRTSWDWELSGWPVYSTPLHLLVANGRRLVQKDRRGLAHSHFNTSRAIEDDFYDTVLALVGKGQCDNFHRDRFGQTIFHIYTGPNRIFRWLKTHDEVQISNLSIEEMHDLLCSRLHSTHCISYIETIREIIPEGKVNKRLAQNFSGNPNFSFSAPNLLFEASRAWASLQRGDGTKEPEVLEGLIKELIRAGSDLHAVALERRYPERHTIVLLIIMYQLQYDDYEPRGKQCFLSCWLRMLAEEGVDLEEFGRMENKLHDENKVPWFWTCFRGSEVIWVEMLELRIGPRPEDLYIEMEDLYVSMGFVAEFWLCVEDSSVSDSGVVAMPGAWRDD